MKRGRPVYCGNPADWERIRMRAESVGESVPDFVITCADALTKPQRFRARAVPPVGGTVGIVVPGEVVVQEIAEGLLGTYNRTWAGEH